MKMQQKSSFDVQRMQDDRFADRQLAQEEISLVSGGMMKVRDAPPQAADNGVTWVPEGTVKVYLGGVQIN
jgi:hypothetical protein